MISNINLQIKDFDIYSNKIGLFYNNKEHLSSYFGLTLTFLYCSILIVLFGYYAIEIINKKQLKIYNSDKYPEDIYSINLNNDLFYFAFGVENPKTGSVFMDETVYYPLAVYTEVIKENNKWKNNIQKNLELEKCNISKFSNEYQTFFKSNTLSNYYCIKDFNGVKLSGSYTYDETAYIKILLYPCINTTENNNHCKSKDIIDYYFSKTYISFLMKDIGITPKNYENPTTPLINNLFTTIGKSYYKEKIIYYKIKEVVSDVGIFTNHLETKNYLKYDREFDSFYMRDAEEFYNGDSICRILIRLSDTIEVQNRIYGKLSEVFATTGGYIQIVNIIFSIIAFIFNKYNMKSTLIEDLFCYNLQKNKLILKNDIEKLNKYNNYKNNAAIFVSRLKSNQLFNENNNKIMNFKSSLNIHEKQLISDDAKNKKVTEELKLDNLKNISGPEYSCNKILNENNLSIDKNKLKSINSVILLNNRSRLLKINDNINYNLDNDLDNSKLFDFKFNIFKYCFYYLFKNRENKEFELYKYGIQMLTNQLDIINVFTTNFFFDNYLKKKDNFKRYDNF